ncbi:hypothetical protein [Mycolicibacterium grossiae]|nr:hypothetical protein [Mycolicibacterium grossiae]
MVIVGHRFLGRRFTVDATEPSVSQAPNCRAVQITMNSDDDLSAAVLPFG